MLQPGKNQGQRAIRAETPPAKAEEVARAEFHLCGKKAGVNLLFLFFPFFLLNVATAECTEAATQTINSHPIFSVQSNPVSWALCHVWTDPVTAPTQAQL